MGATLIPDLAIQSLAWIRRWFATDRLERPNERRPGSASRPNQTRGSDRPLFDPGALTPESRLLLEAIQDPAFLTDAKGRVTYVNSAAAAVLGCPPGQGEGQEDWPSRVFSAKGLPIRPENSEVAELLATGRPPDDDGIWVEREDGARIPFAIRSALLRDDEGRALGTLNILIDASHRQSARDEGDRLGAIVAGSDDAILSKTIDGIITSWNAGAERIFGYAAPEIIGQPVTKIVPPELHFEEETILAALRRGERLEHFDTVRVAKDGRRVDVSLTVSPLYDRSGQVVGASKIARDITRRRQIEAALLEASQVAAQAQREAELASRAKTEFVAVMSHEIRTPLTSISGFVDLLSRTGRLTRAQRRYVGLIGAANTALLTIVNDILDFSRVEAGRLVLEPVPLCLDALARETVAIIEPSATAKGIAIHCIVDAGVPEWLTGDPARLRQILMNLLNNAVKFTETGSVTLRIYPCITGDGDERIHFSIADTGIGIPEHLQHQLFQKFSQLDASDGRRYGGTGLGLAICKRLVNLMGGDIGIFSKGDNGTTVWFTADLQAAERPAQTSEAPVSTPAAEAGNVRILIVDDIDTNREIVSAYLEDHRFKVVAAASAAEAFELMKRETFDLILMDIQMPVMDGVAATRQIRSGAAPGNAIPIIAMTGNVLPQQIRTFLDAGMSDHVGKPIERVKLYNTVWRWLPRPNVKEVPRPTSSVLFNQLTFDELIEHLDTDVVQRTARRFREQLDGAFLSTYGVARREAHDLLNIAGVLGFDSLVVQCRDIEQVLLHDVEQQHRVLERSRTLQAAVLHFLDTVLLPNLDDRVLADLPFAARPARQSGLTH